MNKNNNLLLGDSGSNVTLLQSLLKLNGFYPMLITGVYGPDTDYLVQKFNSEYGINEKNATVSTFNKLYELTNTNEVLDEVLSYPTIQIEDEGSYVTLLQTKLSDMQYFNKEISGYFDENLKTSVQTFQFINKLVTDGIVGVNTWSSLISLYTPLSSCENSGLSNSTYTVQSGDTLYKISTLYNLSVSEIKEINNLTSDIIYPGQVLNLVNESTDNESNSYTVVAKDTLYSIANRFNTTVQSLTQINNLTSDILSIWQVLIINNEPDNKDYDIYTVSKGDTLYKIALKYNMSVAQLTELNNLSTDFLSIGQLLKVYKSDDVLYTVLSGDTLYSIANKFGVTVNYIMNKNDLTSTVLSINQTLYI